MRNEHELWQRIEAKKPAFMELSDRVWGTPELLYDEHRSAAAHREVLEAEGFRIQDGVADIPTAVVGEAGEGGPIIAILGEYDALPGLSQEAGIAEPKPVEAGGNGHGCGHNLLGAGALLAASAVKDWLADKGLPGRVRYYGCPAEEGGAAKAFMVRAGLFDDVAIAITWHPGAFNGVSPAQALANTRIDFTFEGRSAHAAAQPHLGRSALDAVELMSVGVNFLREHVPSECRIHYAYLDAGGIAPNVVQARARVRYAVRAVDRATMRDLVERVRRVAEGAALMTETRVEAKVLSAVSDLVPNTPLERAMHEQFVSVGPLAVDGEDLAFAEAIQATLSPADKRTAFARAGIPFDDGLAIHKDVLPLDADGTKMMGSTDVGDVSWVVPTVQANTATWAVGTPGHSWQVTAQGKTEAAKKATVHAAKVMAGTALAAFDDPALIEAAKADLAARTAIDPYASPIPAEVGPPLFMGRGEG